jgi:hypothetical protein
MKETMSYSDFDYTRLAKVGFFLGVTLFLIGAGGEFIGHAFYANVLPPWFDFLFLDLEILGLVVGFFSPFVFGIFFPLLD